MIFPPPNLIFPPFKATIAPSLPDVKSLAFPVIVTAVLAPFAKAPNPFTVALPVNSTEAPSPPLFIAISPLFFSQFVKEIFPSTFTIEAAAVPPPFVGSVS